MCTQRALANACVGQGIKLGGHTHLALAWLRLRWPWLTRFTRFSPMTYIRWLQAKGRSGHADKTATGKLRGQPPTPQFIIDAILTIKCGNWRHSAGHIARMIPGGELRFRISKKTVAQILKTHGFKPGPKGKRFLTLSILRMLIRKIFATSSPRV